VNLDRSTDRLAEFCNVNRHLTSVSRFPAVDGSRLDLNTLVSQGVVTKDILTMFSVGAVGCAMSHLGLWERSIASNKAVTISEDDAIFNHGFDSHAEQLLAGLPNDWDMIFWGFNFDMFLCFDMLPGVTPCCVATFDQELMRAGAAAFQKLSITPQAFKLIWAFGTCCYSISPLGARKLKEKIVPFRPQVIPLPEARNAPPFSLSWRTVGIDNSINSAHREIKSFVCFPPLAISKHELDKSTIHVLPGKPAQNPPAALVT
jgi:GR25 family glycosyltransferase involved in LPS biosynthesis